MQNLGQDAKEIAFAFFNETHHKVENVPKVIVQAKRLLKNYPKEDILVAIKMNADKMYSLGYLTQEVINKALAKNVVEQQKQMSTFETVGRESVEIAERNKRKLENNFSKSRFGKGYSFDMLKEPK